ncbi:sensor histidine kinase [Sinomicrobium weinanense]|uniref:Histidine kinase n=1 Tax=Sinomicrobium weinanense TaxID=2842200 RepID=A0A926Q0R9_9FLAO|nr:histidine kinase [Sinomicrobium weinanense]MBC9795038.1 histidine kinase [Sinomicrobium weinanense]MBU3123833.1 histidine kinase [Sinomicrobium weinanense]
MMFLDPYESFLIIVSILGTTICFNLALYFGYHKRAAYLFFALYCLFHIFKVYLKGLPAEERIIPLLPLTTYDYIYLSVLLGMSSLQIFLLYHFALPFKKYIIPSLIGISILSFFLLDEYTYIFIGLGIALLQTLWAWKNKKDVGIILLGVIGFSACVLLRVFGYMPYGYFVGIIFFIFCMFLSVGLELARQNRGYQQALLRSSWLENQLLKKSIQPHFLFNSLTSLQELIDTDPEKAGNFVDNLSKEFELFSKISHEKLIPVKDELELIRHYLDIMAVRKSIKFNLETANLNEADRIPPGVFLTLVENGITHGYENGKAGNFRITKKESKSCCRYEVFNDGENTRPGTDQGMGHQYVLSRLEESYGRKYDFSSSPCTGGWLSVIKIFL